MHHVETGGRQYLLDCGLYQGHRHEAFARNSQFPLPASAIDAVILSHAHIDHSGILPGLVKRGFQGPIYTTPATVDLCLAMLADSASPPGKGRGVRQPPPRASQSDRPRRPPGGYDPDISKYLINGDDPFGFHRLTYIRDVAESKKLDDLRWPCVIISASGMCGGSRILHHLRNNMEDPRNTILITGFQAEYTLGRKIVEKQSEVPVFGEPMRLRAKVCSLNELSGHADRQRHEKGFPGPRRGVAGRGADPIDSENV